MLTLEAAMNGDLKRFEMGNSDFTKLESDKPLSHYIQICEVNMLSVLKMGKTLQPLAIFYKWLECALKFWQVMNKEVVHLLPVRFVK